MRPPDDDGALTGAQGVATLGGEGSEIQQPSEALQDKESHVSDSLAMLPAGFDARRTLAHHWRQSFATRTSHNYLKANGLLPVGFQPIGFARELGLTLAQIRIWRAGRFSFADERNDGDLVPGVIIECRDVDDEREETVDLVAWRQDDPHAVYSYLGRVGLLGVWNARLAGQYLPALRILDTPLEWLQMGGLVGAAIVDQRLATPEIRTARHMGPVVMPSGPVGRRIKQMDRPPYPLLIPKAA